MKLQALFVVFAAGLLIAAHASKDDGKDDPKKLQGTWIVVSGEKDGVKPPEDQLKDIKIEFLPRK